MRRCIHFVNMAWWQMRTSRISHMYIFDLNYVLCSIIIFIRSKPRQSVNRLADNLLEANGRIILKRSSIRRRVCVYVFQRSSAKCQIDFLCTHFLVENSAGCDILNEWKLTCLRTRQRNLLPTKRLTEFIGWDRCRPIHFNDLIFFSFDFGHQSNSSEDSFQSTEYAPPVVYGQVVSVCLYMCVFWITFWKNIVHAMYEILQAINKKEEPINSQDDESNADVWPISNES